MAFDHAGFFAVVGKHIKAINIYDGYIDAVETHKGDIQNILETEDLPDLYIPYPPIFIAVQDGITSWINTLISTLESFITHREYVIEQLPTLDKSPTGVLNALYEYMIDNSVTIKESVVTLSGSDVDLFAKVFNIGASNSYPFLMCSRILDGVNDPGNRVIAHKRYSEVESQLARTTTVYGEIISTGIPGQETIQLFSSAVETGAYVLQDEEPGIGPTIVNATSTNVVNTNPNFTAWTANNPDGWNGAGGVAGTDWQDFSGAGNGPLRLNTQGVTMVQKITGLERNRSYLVAVQAQGGTGDTVVGIKVRNLADTIDYMAQRTGAITIDNFIIIAFGFLILDDAANLDDVYLEIEFVTDTAADYLLINKIVVSPTIYYNGLGWAFWAPLQTSPLGTNLTSLGLQADIAVANNDAGVIQSYFRKAHFIQLPTDGAPSIADSVAT